MTAVGWLPAGTEELFGADAAAEESYDLLTVDVPPGSWITALETARDRLGCTYFDWLSAVDEPGVGFRVAAHVAALGPVRRLLLRTTVPHEAPVLPTAVGVYAGAAWHERETHEMFGVAFEDHPALDHLLLPEGFEGHPLRKDFVLAARVAKAWPGAKEPGESDHGGPRRRQMLPPGVPDPNEWGPLKGQLPPAPARPARGAGRAAGERPARRTRTAAEGSVGQQTPGAETPAAPRRSRTAAEGSVSQASPAGEPTAAPAPRRSRSASQGSASQRAAAPTGGATGSPTGNSTGSPTDNSTASPSDGSMGRPTDSSMGGPTAGPPADTVAEQRDVAGNVRPRRARSASQGSASQREASPTEEPARKPAPSTPRSPDAPWHHARPAFDEPAAAEGEAEASQQPPDTPDGTDTPNEPDAPGEPAPSGEQASSREPAPSEEPDPAEESDASGASDTAGESDVPRTPPNPPGGPQ
ncbi:NADH-quinone oxidoreductase subunit C [Streptomyces salinarius]|uniref:NADH-quinone oxidoreductase subunit C n=1 Tax=Streptomyces salinarius TaxID=2762598 RepID=A0ABW8BCJ6_9ACTN